MAVRVLRKGIRTYRLEHSAQMGESVEWASADVAELFLLRQRGRATVAAKQPQPPRDACQQPKVFATR